MRYITEIAIVITEPVTTKVKGNGTCAFEPEFMLVGEGLDDGGRILARNQLVVNVHCDVLVVISAVAHPNVTFSFGWNESHVAENVG